MTVLKKGAKISPYHTLSFICPLRHIWIYIPKFISPVNEHYSNVLLCRVRHTVVSLIFVGYQFSWFLWVALTHENWFSTNRKFYIVVNGGNFKTMNLRIHELTLFYPTKKIDTHENKWIHSNTCTTNKSSVLGLPITKTSLGWSVLDFDLLTMKSLFS